MYDNEEGTIMCAAMTANRKPDSAGLATRHLQLLDRKLRAERETLLCAARDELLRAETQPFAAIAGEVPDVGDSATAAALTDFDNEIARRHDEAIREIDEALARLGAGEYGCCPDCGADIGFERLMAFPTARRCVTCQSLHERTYASLARPTM